MDRGRVTLRDKFDLGTDRVFISGTQAIVRLLLMQHARDRAAGLNTAGFVSGYRGSPLGGLDINLWRAKAELDAAEIVFRPGLNEDLAATAVWGSQQAEMRGEGRYDGVFGLWYGKGPGVDRSGDALRHANFAGTSRHGGVIALMGDDHTCESSTTAHQSEFAFVDAMMPILNPAGVQEILDYGLYGWALSRFAGVWVGIKCVKDNVESTGSIDGSGGRVATIVPDHPLPPGGLNIRRRTPLEQEELLHLHKRPAILAFLRQNLLDRMVMAGGSRPWLGIVSLGKSYLDTRQALDLLGIDEVRAADLGIRFLKVAAPWPLEPSSIARFADGLKAIVVVEEKRSLVETQLKEQLYGRAEAPVVVGKKGEDNRTLFPSWGALEATDIARALGRRIVAETGDAEVAARLHSLEEAAAVTARTESVALRVPHFCSGCPHNTSTRVPEGSRAYAGIGCHYMALWMDRDTDGYTQMGAEGANWIGEAPFSTRGHVFQNLGDGTYNHSGSLAMRAAAGAGINITYKILFNDAVAMTGGQKNDGGLTVDRIAREVAAEGAKRVALVTDDPHKYPPGTDWPRGLTIHHRADLDAVQRELREIEGMTVLIYDQTCAAEKRRRRKRGIEPEPDRRVFINSRVCEGCGDCGVKSNCVSIQPLETDLGRKRVIDQSSCNKDYSCLDGFCPSFVTVHGGKLRKGRARIAAATLPAVPEPQIPALEHPVGILITGVGGTGVVTIGAILGMAAHLEGHGVGLIDMAGLAQKGGAVTTHMRIAPRQDEIHAIRVATEEADTVLACDIVVAGSQKSLMAIRPGRSRVFVNIHETYPGDFTRDADFTLPSRRLTKAIGERAGPGAHFIEAQRLASALLGDAIATNMFMVGYAWQQGGIPLPKAAILEAIRLNGVEEAMNVAAFEWGRRAAHDPEGVAEIAGLSPPTAVEEETLEALVDRRAAFLRSYQGRRYARRYRDRVASVAAAEAKVAAGDTLARTVAEALFHLMAIKDEYEVARLFADREFEAELRETFESWERLEFHLAPPAFAKVNTRTGHPAKRIFGPATMRLFRLLAALRRIRGTLVDPFRWTSDRRFERELLADYEATLEEITAKLTRAHHDVARRIVAYPLKIRGYGHVRRAQARPALAERDALLETFRAPEAPQVAEAAE